MAKTENPVEAKAPRTRKPQTAAQKAARAAKAKAKKDAVKLAAQSDVLIDETQSNGKEFWARQIRLNGRTITGEVKPEEKEEWLRAVRNAGGKVVLSKWIIKEDWRERVLKQKAKK